MNCLILEDEPLAAEVLRDYIADVPGLELRSICGNAFEALDVLRKEKIDLLFVDINLPKVSGLDFIRSLQEKHHIILTTAYHEFALEGFDLNVVDYLLKPIEFSRFVQAVNKVMERGAQRTNDQPEERRSHFFNVDKKLVKVSFDDILYVESLKDYVRIHTVDNKIVTKFQIGEMEELLTKGDFIRCHKSYIINLHKISSLSAMEVGIGKVMIPIGRTYKEGLEKRVRE